METLEFEKKVLLIGDGSVGKTSLVRRFVIDKFDDKYITTIGTKTSRKPMDFKFPDEDMHIKIQLDIWDILGQEGMERAHRMYFKGAEAVIIVADGTRRPTFDSLTRWGKEVYENCGAIPGTLAINKVDLGPQFQVTDEEAGALSRQLNLKVYHTSAKTGENVEEMFQQVGQYLCGVIRQNYAPGKAPPAVNDPGKKKGRFGR